MKFFFIQFTLLVVSLQLHAQIIGVVIDNSSLQPISFVNISVEGQNVGTTANEHGKFSLSAPDSSQVLVFSAVGYSLKKINVADLADTVLMNSSSLVFNDVIVLRDQKREVRELRIGSFKKSKVKSHIGSGGNPAIKAQFFGYKTEYDKTPYLRAVNILTHSDLKNAVFHLRLYRVSESGGPGEYLLNEPIYCEVRKGNRITEINLSDFNIIFPAEGFLVAVESLIIEKNRFEHKTSFEDSRKKEIRVTYEPAFGILESTTNKTFWHYVSGKWQCNSTFHAHKSNLDLPDKIRKFSMGYYSMAIELVLSN